MFHLETYQLFGWPKSCIPGFFFSILEIVINVKTNFLKFLKPLKGRYLMLKIDPPLKTITIYTIE